MGTEKIKKANVSIKLFDTTLRDGSQREKINFSLADKLAVASILDEFGVDYIEGGWPGANPKDADFFKSAAQRDWKNSKIVAFGSTRRKNQPPEKDKNLNALLKAETPAVSIFGKSWRLHIQSALKVCAEENLQMVYDSVDFMLKHGIEVIFDAEHFFDGYKDDPDFAVNVLSAAVQAGAGTIVLCDTNGGSTTFEVYEITKNICEMFDIEIGIHAHNDSDLAVANSLSAVEAGARHVQGTINGLGERCGNANLISVIPNLQLKMGYFCVPEYKLKTLTDISALVNEIANIVPRNETPFVGTSAFAHKGGVHVSAVMKNPATYEHINPDLVGNKRRVLISDLSGKSNVQYKMSELGFENLNAEQSRIVVERIKELENKGYSYEAADASFELLVHNSINHDTAFFNLSGFRQFTEKNADGDLWSEASIRVEVNGEVEHTAASGNGPVNALDNALRKALVRFYPEIAGVKLIDFKVRVINEAGKKGTASKVRVLIQMMCREKSWSTVGVSENIIEASWQALVDSYNYFLLKKINKINVEVTNNETQSINF